MSKNHYISQLIIRRFSKEINVLDLKAREINEKKRPHKVFYKRDLYQRDIEDDLGNKIEGPFGNLLDKKLLNPNEVILTRRELYLLKQYLLLDSIRTLGEEGFYNIIQNFTRMADMYNGFRNGELDKLPYIKETNDTPKELYMKALRVIIDCDTVDKIINHKYATKELYCWSKPFLDSYLAFWDADENQDFILTDSGMTTEYEAVHHIFEGLDMSKKSYLLSTFDKVDKNNKKSQGIYYNILTSCIPMYENLNIFNLSYNRCMVLINPFFKLYTNYEEYGVKNPDIWPAVIQERKAFNTPKNDYLIDKTYLTMEDKFIYTPFKLSYEDTIYINKLLLGVANEIIGFRDLNNVLMSAYVNSWANSNYNTAEKNKDVKDIKYYNILPDLFIELINEPTTILLQYAKTLTTVDFDKSNEIFNKITYNQLRDSKTNYYFYDYYLNNPDMLNSMQNFEWIRKRGHNVIKYFKYNRDLAYKNRIIN